MENGKSGSRIIKIVINFLSTIIFLISIAAIAFALITVKISENGKGQEVEFFGLKGYSVLSGSMSPTFNKGAFIIVKKVSDPRNLKVKDIVAFIPATTDKTRVTHRIVEKNEVDGQIEFITKGDNNPGPDDPPLTTDRLVGKVVFYVNGVGDQLRNMNNTYFLGATVFLIILLLIMPYIV